MGYEACDRNPVEFGSVFMTLGCKAPNCELFLNGRWYPVTMHVQFGCAHFFASDAIAASIQTAERCVNFSPSVVALELDPMRFIEPASETETGSIGNER